MKKTNDINVQVAIEKAIMGALGLADREVAEISIVIRADATPTVKVVMVPSDAEMEAIAAAVTGNPKGFDWTLNQTPIAIGFPTATEPPGDIKHLYEAGR